MSETELLLEQYKLYIEMTDRISSRRAQANKFYISILSGLLALLSVIVEKDFNVTFLAPIILAISILGLGINLVWYVNIRSYRQLNTGKFKVIHEMEQRLPYACYDKEWEFLGQGKNVGQYFQLTRVERYVPFILGIPYLLLFIYSIIIWR